MSPKGRVGALLTRVTRERFLSTKKVDEIAWKACKKWSGSPHLTMKAISSQAVVMAAVSCGEKVLGMYKGFWKFSWDRDFFGTVSARLRYEVLRDSGGHCCLCGRGPRQGVALEVDHIIPRSIRPDLSRQKENLQVLCERCNAGKGNRCTQDLRIAA